MDVTNQYIATKWILINRNVDNFFTNKKSSTSENHSSIFVYSSFYKKEGQKIEMEHDFQLKFDLPNTTKKLKIVIEKQQDDIGNAISDTSAPDNKTLSKEGGGTRRKNDTHYEAGANFLLSQSKYFISFLHFGIRLDVPLNPSIKLDLQKDFTTEYVNIGLLQKIIMYRQEGLQNVSQLSFNKKWNETFQTDFVHSLVWSDETDILVLRNSIILYQDLGNERGLSYSVGANARFKPTFYYDSYDTSVSYRQRLYNDWLYGTFTVGAGFPKANNFDDEKFVQIRVDLFFKE